MDRLLDPTALLGVAFDYYASAPEAIRPGLKNILMEPVQGESIIKLGPFLYAHYDLLDAPGKKLTGQLFDYAGEMHWTMYNEKNQSDKIVLAVRRDLGESGDFPATADDPEPDASLREGNVNWKHPEASSQPPAPADLP